MAQDAQIAQFQAALDSHPEFQQLARAFNAEVRAGYRRPNSQIRQLGQQMNQIVRQLGIQVPQGYFLNPSTGKIERENILARHPDLVMAIAAAGVGAAFMPGVGGGGGGAPETTAAVSGTTAAPAATGVAGGATGLSGGATSVAAGSSPSILGRIGGIAQDVAPILGGAARDRATGQQANDLYEISRGRLDLDQNAQDQRDAEFGANILRRDAEFGADFDRNERQFGANLGERQAEFATDTGFRNKDLELTAPDKRLSTGVRGSMVANQQPVTHTWGGPGSGMRGGGYKVSGGFANPNLISPDARALAEDITHQALLNQLKHDDHVDFNPVGYTPGTYTPPSAYTPPERKRITLPDPGRSSTVDRILGGGATLAPILGSILRRF